MSQGLLYENQPQTTILHKISRTVRVSMRGLLSGPLTFKTILLRVLVFVAFLALLMFGHDAIVQKLNSNVGQQGRRPLPTPDHWMTGKRLRILTVGDSITEGYGSTTGDGYRGPLYELLTRNGNSIEMVGSLKGGTMAQNSNEGWGGMTIEQIATKTSAYGTRPNVILLLAGTNDAYRAVDVSRAADRLDSLVEQLFQACPDATIFVGNIIPSTNHGTMANIKIINPKITAYMAARAEAGQHVVLVDLPAVFNAESLLADFLHPNDKGYERLAHAWAYSLNEAADRGWIGEPVDPA